METMGNILHNIKTRWTFMFSLVKHELVGYCTLFMKMALHAPTITNFRFTLCLFIDVETLLAKVEYYHVVFKYNAFF
jgi:hypothetical protein